MEETDNALVVHFRELERGVDMPDIREQNVGPVDPHFPSKALISLS
jgi:hypothetical protein